MNIRILNCGVIGGLLAAYFLSFPLYIVLPTKYTDWNGLAESWMGPFGNLLAGLVVVATGYAAARWDWQTGRRERANTAALAGMIAGLIAYALIGAPAAAVASQESAWLKGAHVQPNEGVAVAIVVDCVLRAAWLPFLAFWGMFAGGTILGCLGGWIAAFDPAAANWGLTPPRRATASAFDSSVALMYMGALILVVILSALTSLEINCANSIARFGLQTFLPTEGVTACPVAMVFVLIIVATAFCGQWCAARWNHPMPGMQRTARLAGVMMVALPVLTLLLVNHIRADMFQHWYFLIGETAWFAVMLYWLLRIKIKPGPQPGATPPPSASFRDRLVLNAGFIGAVYPAIVLSTGVTTALALALGIVPYIATIFPPTNRSATPAAQTVGVAATSPYGAAAMVADSNTFPAPPPATSAPPRPPSAHALIQDIYTTHVWGTCGMVALWFVATAIHGVVVQALPVLWKARLAAAAPRLAVPSEVTNP